MPANYQANRIPSKTGYDPKFLGLELPLPEFGPELIDEIVDRPELRDGVYADYLLSVVRVFGTNGSIN